MTISVSDTGSNTEENIERAVRALGRSKPRLAVFEAVYFHKKRTKTVQEIADKTGLDRKIVLTHGKYLVESGLAEQTKAKDDTAYRTLSFYQHHKQRILRLVADPKKLEKLPTKRRPELSKPTSFVRATKVRKSSSKAPKKMLRVAYLVTNPQPAATLNTLQEAKQVTKAIEASSFASKIELRPFLAPSFDDLIDALNRFKPHMVHFSGHGGDKTLLFDNENIGETGGTVLDFDTVAELLDAVDFKPRGLILMACDTVEGADKFLETTDFVIAMADSIDDDAASEFSVRFYKSISSGVALETAVKQGKLSIKSKGYTDSDLPTLISSTGSVRTKPLVS
ncbi:CHAT domain-containing protein [Aurantiacibacter gangjinensis]|nr:CHAT domain-containing protein [Aurantiacibacter gangjinensis]